MIIVFGHLYAALCIDIGQAPNSSEYNLSMGGSALKQAISAARSGAKVSLVGTLSTDLFGKNILNSIRKEGIHTAGIAQSDTPTGLQTTINDAGSRSQDVISIGANTHTHAEQIPNEKMNERALLLIQNDIAPKINLGLIMRAKQNGARVVMTLTSLENQTKELRSLCDIIIATADIYDDLNVDTHDTYIISLKNNGVDGAHVHLNSAELHSSKTANDTTNVKDIIDTKTSFDSFCGCFAACIQAGLPLSRAINIAHHAALLSAKQKHGADRIPYIGHVEDAMSDYSKALKA